MFRWIAHNERETVHSGKLTEHIGIQTGELPKIDNQREQQRDTYVFTGWFF